MFEGTDSMESPPTYLKGDIVWVKLSGYWWPGEVINEEDLPSDLLSDFKKPPLVIVKFFEEDSYEYIKQWSAIYPYNCEKKNEFIKKGMAGYRAKLSHMAKFPRDIGTAEEKTNGNPNILSQPEFLPNKKINYDEIFGTPSPKKSTKGKNPSSVSKKSATKDSNEPLITHRRFLGNDDYRAYIWIQYPGKDCEADEEIEEIQKLNEEPSEFLTCQACVFKTKRLGVMLMHTKMHLNGVNITSKRKNKKAKGVDLSDSETEASTVKSPKPKQRKKKVETKSKPRDVFTDLLEEWDDTDEETDGLGNKSVKAKNQDTENEKDDMDTSEVQAEKSATNHLSDSSKAADTPKASKNTQDDIKNCFDFDEEEEEDDFMLPASSGRKIPRVIPEKPRASISELLEMSQKDDDLYSEKVIETSDEPSVKPTESESDVSSKEILRSSENLNLTPSADEAIESTFRELMEETAVPALDDLSQVLKPEQNFHDARTVKFPDKGGTSFKSGTSRKRFVTSFEDFEAGFRKIEGEESSRLSAEREGKHKKAAAKIVNKELPEQIPEAPKKKIEKEVAVLEPHQEIIVIGDSVPTHERKTRLSDGKKPNLSIVEDMKDVDHVEIEPEKKVRRRTKQLVIDEDSAEIIEFAQDDHPDNSAVKAEKVVNQLDKEAGETLAVFDAELEAIKKDLEVSPKIAHSAEESKETRMSLEQLTRELEGSCDSVDISVDVESAKTIDPQKSHYQKTRRKTKSTGSIDVGLGDTFTKRKKDRLRKLSKEDAKSHEIGKLPVEKAEEQCDVNISTATIRRSRSRSLRKELPHVGHSEASDVSADIDDSICETEPEKEPEVTMSKRKSARNKHHKSHSVAVDDTHVSLTETHSSVIATNDLKDPVIEDGKKSKEVVCEISSLEAQTKSAKTEAISETATASDEITYKHTKARSKGITKNEEQVVQEGSLVPESEKPNDGAVSFNQLSVELPEDEQHSAKQLDEIDSTLSLSVAKEEKVEELPKDEVHIGKIRKSMRRRHSGAEILLVDVPAEPIVDFKEATAEMVNEPVICEDSTVLNAFANLSETLDTKARKITTQRCSAGDVGPADVPTETIVEDVKEISAEITQKSSKSSRSRARKQAKKDKPSISQEELTSQNMEAKEAQEIVTEKSSVDNSEALLEPVNVEGFSDKTELSSCNATVSENVIEKGLVESEVLEEPLEQAVSRVSRRRSRKSTKHEEPPDVAFVVEEPVTTIENKDIEITEKPTAVPEELEAELPNEAKTATFSEITVESEPSIVETPGESPLKVISKSSHGKSRRRSNKIEELLDIAPIVVESDSETTPHSQAALELDDLVEATENKVIEIMEQPTAVPQELEAEAKMATSSSEITVKSVPSVVETPGESTPTPEITFKTGHEKSQRSNKVEEPLDVTPHFHAPLELEERVEGTENKDIEIMEKPTAVPEKFETGISIEEAEAKTATSSEITVENVLSLAETPGQSAPKVRRGRPRKSIKIEKQLDVTAVVGEPCNVTEEKSIEIFEEPPKVPEKLEVEICTAEIPIESAQSATETSEQSTLKVRRGRPRKASKTEEPLDVTPVVGEPGKPTEEMDIEITEKPSEVPEKLEVDISAAEIPVESAQSASETSDESTPKVRRGRSRKSSKIEESLDVTPVVGEPAKATEEKDIEIEKRSEVREILKADISAAELVVESVQPDTETFEESTVKVKRGRPRKSTKTAEHFDDKDAVLKQETIEQSDKLDLEVSPDEIVETIETSESLVELTTTDAAVEHSEEPVSKFRRGRSRKSIKIDEATFVAEVDRATEIEPQIPKDSSKETEKLEPALSVEEIVAERAGASQITEESLSEAVVEKPLSKVRRGRSRKSISIEEPQDAVPVEREVASEIEETTIELENTDVPAVEEVCIEKAETSEVVLETVDLDLKRPEAVGEHVEEPMPKPRRGRPRKSSRIEESLDIAPVVEPNKASEINNSALGLKNAEEISEKLDQIEPAIHAEELDAKTVESSESTTSEAVIESAEEPALKVRRGRSRKSTKIGDFSDSIPTLEESHAMESKSDASSLPEAKSLDRPEPAVSVVEVDVEAPETSVENAQNLDSEIAISEVGAESSEFAPKIRRGRPRKSIKIEESLNVTAAAEERVSAPKDKVNNVELVDAKESAKMIDSQPETAIVAEGADAKMPETSKITEEAAQLAPTELEAVVEHHAKFIPKPRRGKSRKGSKILEPLDQKAEVNEPEALVETATVDIEEFSKELDAGGTKDSVNYAESTHLESAKVEVEIEPSKEATSKTRRGKHRKNTKIEEPLEVAPVVEEYVPKTSHEKKLEIPRTLEESIAQSKEALESNTEAVEESSSKTRHRKSRRSNKIGEPSEVAPVVEESDSKTSHEAMEESIAQSTEVLESNMEAVESSCKTRRGKSRSSYKIEELSDVAAVVEESVTKTSHEKELETPRVMEESIAQSMEMLGPNIEAVAESSSRSRHGKSRKTNKIEKPLDVVPVVEDSVSKTNHETMEESIAQSTEELEPNIEAAKECSTKTRHGKSRRSNKIEEPLGVVPMVEESISKTSHEAMEESIAQSTEVLEPNIEAVKESSSKTRHGKSRKTNKIEEPLDAAPVVEESVPKASHENDHEIPRPVEESIAQSTGVLEQNIEAVEESRSRTRHGKSLRRNKIEEPLDRPPIVEESVFKTNYEINVHEIPLPMEEPIAQSTGALEPNITAVEEPSAKTRHGKSRRSNKIEESSDIAPVVVESDSKTSHNEASLNLAESSAPVGECALSEELKIKEGKSRRSTRLSDIPVVEEIGSETSLTEERAMSLAVESSVGHFSKVRRGNSRKSTKFEESFHVTPVLEQSDSKTSLTEASQMLLTTERESLKPETIPLPPEQPSSKVRRGKSRKGTRIEEPLDIASVVEKSDFKLNRMEESQASVIQESNSKERKDSTAEAAISGVPVEESKQSDVKIDEAVPGESISSKTSENYQTEAVKTDVTAEISSQKSTSRRKRGKSRWDTVEPNTNTSPIIEIPESKSAETAEVAEIPETPIEGSESEPALQPLAEHSPKRKERLQWQTEEETALNLKEPVAVHESWKDDYKTEVSEIVSELGPPIEAEIISEPAVAGELEISSVEAQVPANEFVKSHVEVPLEPPKDQHSEAPSELELESENNQLTESKELPSKLTSKESETSTSKGRKGKARKHSKLDKDVDVELTEKTVQSSESTDDKVAAVENKTGLGGAAKNIERSTDRTPEKDIFTELPFELIGMLEKRKSSRRHDRYGEEKSSLNEPDAKVPSKSLFDESSRSGRDRKRKVSGEILPKEVKEDKRKSKYHKKGKPDVVEPAPLDSSYQSEELNQRLTETIDTHCEVRYSRSRDSRKDKRESRRSRSPKQLVPDDVHEDYSRDSRKERERRRRSRSPKKLLVNLDRLREDRLGRSRDNRKEREERRRSRSPKQMFEDSFGEKDYRSRSRDSKKEREEKYRSRSHRKSKTSSKAQEPSHSDVAGLEDLSKQSTESEQSLQSLGEGVQDIPTYAALKEDGFGMSSPRKSTFTGIVSDTVYGSKSKIRPAQVRSKLSRWDVVSRPDGDQAFEKDAALVIPDDLPKIDDKPFEKPDVLVEKAGFGEDESSSVLVMTNHDRNKVHLETEASDKDSCVNFEHQIEDLPKVQTGVFEPSKEAENDASKEELERAVEPVRKDVIENDSQELKSEDSVIIESHNEVESVKEVVEMQEKHVGTLELQSELIETKSTPLGTDRDLIVETAKFEVPFTSAQSEITSFSLHKDLETTFLEEETVEVKSHSIRKRKRSRRSKSITDHISPERDVPLAVEDNVEAPTSEIADGAEAKVLDYTTDVTLALANVPVEEESGAAIFGDSKIDSRIDSAMEQENIDSTPVVTNTDAAVATAITEDEVKDISVAETLHAAIVQGTSSESLKMEVSSAEHTSDLNIPIKEALDSVVESVTEAKEEEEPSTTVDKVEDLSIKEATSVNNEYVQIAHENVEIEAEQENCEVVSIKDDAQVEVALTEEAANVGDIEVENKLDFAVSHGLSKIDDGVVDVSNANVEASVIPETEKPADETEIPSVTEEVILHPVVLEEAVVDVTTDSVATAVETDIQGKEEPLGTVKSDSSTGPDGIHDQIVAEDLSLTKVEPEPLILEDNDTVTVNDVSVPHNDMVIVPYSGAEDLSTKDRIPKSSGEVPGSVDDIIPPSVAAASDPSPSDPLELFAAEPAQTVVEHFDDRPLSPKDPIEIPSEVAKAIDVLETDLSKDSEPVEPQKDEDLRGSIRKDKKGRQRKYSEDKLSVDETPEKMVELENSADILENEDKVEKIVEVDLIENREISYCSEPTATEKSTEPQIVTESCEVLDEEMLGSVPNQELIDFSGQQNEPQDLSPSVGDDKEKLLDVSSQVEQVNEKEPSEKGQQNKVQDLSHTVIDDKEKLLDVPSQIDQADRKEPSESENISEIEGTIFAMSSSKKVKKSKRFSQNVELAAPTVDSCYKESSDEASKGHQSGQQNEPEDLSPSVIDDKGKLLDASSQIEYANRKERSEEENITQLEGTIFSISTSKKVKKNKRFSQDVELAAPTESCYIESLDETSKGTTSIEQDFSVEQATLPEGVQQGELEHVPEEARSKKSRHHKHSKPEITPEGPFDYSIRHLSEDLSKESDGADEESSTETGGDEKSRKPSQEYSKASAEIVDQKSSETHPVAIETTIADDSLPEMSKNKPSVDKLKSMPPKKSRWSRRGSYTKKDSDNEQETASAPAHVEEKPVELESVVIEKTDQPTIEANTHENSASSFNDSEIILPPKKSKRVNEVSSQFFTDDFQSPEKKSDADSLCFPSYDDSFMSTTLRNNIEGLIKEIDSIDSNVIPDHSELQRVESDFKPFEMSEAKSEAPISEHLLANSPLSEDSRGGLKEGIEIPKGVPPKKKKIELPKDEYFGLPPNNLPQHDMSKSEEKVLDTMPQPPKKKMQKLFENSQAIEKVDKTPDFLLMSPLAKKKSFLFHHEEFDQTQKVEGILQPQKETASDLSKEAGKLSDPPQESIYNTDVDEFLDLPKIRKKRKSSSLRDYPPKKEKLEEKEIFTDDHDQKSKDTFSYGSLQKAAETPLSDITGFSTPVGEDSKPCTSNNEMEVKIEESDFKFNIQTNLSILSTSKAEELSALASKTLSEIKKDVIAECPRAFKKTEKQLLVPPTVKSTEDIKDVKPEVALPQLDPPVPVSALNEPELVPISVTPTVMSEKDLADAQVEITTDKVISEKKPTFPMDFVVVKTEPGTTKPTETVGTEFTSKAMVKEFDNRPLISKPNAYALKSELLDILEGNSNSSTNSSGSEQKFKTSFDNYDKNSTVQGIIDFEEAIPSQIVLSNKVSAESVLMDSPKLLERLSMSSDSGKAKAPTMLIQGDIKVSESLSKAFISKLTKATSGIPKPGQKIVIKTQKAMSKGTKPIILSEQIIRPANAGPSTVKPSGQAQGLKRQYEDVEDVETAFIIPKIAKKNEEVEEPAPPTPVEKPSRARGSKISGKAKILQQTIITPKGEVIPQAPPTTAGKTIQLQQVQIQPGPDDAVFDINSMPIVLSDDILTPESIQNMPVVLSEEVLPQSTTAPAAKGQEKLLSTMSKKIVSGIGTKQIIFKTTQPGSGAPVPLKHAGKARILSTSSAAPSSRIAKPTATALLATGTTADGKPAKYVLVPPSVTPATTQVKSVKQAVPKKQVVVPSKLPTPAAATAATTDQSGQIVGNKIMIVTNAQGQQTRVVLTPQQQKAFMQAQPGSKTKAIIKGAIPKALLESAAAVAAAGPSGIAKTVATVAAPGPALPVSSHGGLVMPTVKSVKAPVPPKKGVQKPMSKPQKTILIKNQLGQTVRKIQGTDDDDLDRQVAEQLEAIKASARLQQANKTPEIINYTNRQIPSANSRSAIRKSYSKKVDPLKVKIPVPVPQTEAQKPAETSVPALAPLSPQPRIPQIQNQTPQIVTTKHAPPRKVDPPASSSLNKALEKCDIKPPVAPAKEVETKRPESPLRQVVIQDGLGNLTTVTVGQILAIPSETVDGQPQSYMLVTVDESGNLTPLNNDALMSLDPSLGAAGDVNNMMLQVDQGQQGTVAAIKPAESTVAHALVEEKKKVEERVKPEPTKPVLPVKEPKAASVLQARPHEVPLAVEQQIVIGEGVLPGDSGGQQLIVTGDPIATQKFLESLSDGSTDLANILANAEGGSVLIQADGQQILIRANPGAQPMMGMTESTEGGGNPIFATHKPNQDILAAALANTDVFQPTDQLGSQTSPIKGLQPSQLSPGGAGLYPMHVGNVLETSLTLSSPIMTPLEVPSTNSKKIDDDVDILNQVPKNVDLPITITDPNISQTVAHQQAAGLMELTLPITETPSADINSPSYSYSLPALEDSVGISQKSFSSSMPLLTEDVVEVESSNSSNLDRIRACKELKVAPSSFSPNFGSLPMLPDTIESSREEVVKTSTLGDIGSLSMLTDDVIEDSGSSMGSTKPPRSSPKTVERDIVDEGLSTLGGEMCSSLSEPPPDMFDLSSLTHKEEEVSSDVSSIPEPETLSLNSENSGEIPIQPPIVATLSDLKRSGEDSDGSDEKRPRFD